LCCVKDGFNAEGLKSLNTPRVFGLESWSMSLPVFSETRCPKIASVAIFGTSFLSFFVLFPSIAFYLFRCTFEIRETASTPLIVLSSLNSFWLSGHEFKLHVKFVGR
jgi:tellurite resistance protein TehA-like permease